MTFYAMSQIERRAGKLVKAREHAEDGLKLLKQMGDRKNQASVFFQLSWVDTELDANQMALDEAYDSLAIYRDMKDEWATARLLLHMGDVLGKLDRVVEARETWQEGLVLATRIGHPSVEALHERLNLADNRPSGQPHI